MADSALTRAINWLTRNQTFDGSYGPYFEGQTAAAVFALWLANSTSPNAALGISYLTRQLENSSSWFWGSYGEADVPGEILHSLAATQSLKHIQNITPVSAGLLQFQQANGGFQGYYDASRSQTVTTSVDTAESLWGLIDAKTIGDKNQSSASSYLLSLQNGDGSFNLTQSIRADPIYSLGPDPASITALATLALKSAGFNICSTPVEKALSFLSSMAGSNFDGPGHLYAAALTTMTFTVYYRLDDASKALAYLVSQQNSDGGFRDMARGQGSNALDTGWAGVALQFSSYWNSRVESIDHVPIAKFNFSPREPVEAATVSFDASKSSDPDNDCLVYSWAFGDGIYSSGVNPTHAYTRTGNFTVTLTIEELGTAQPLSNTTWQTLEVQPAAVQASPAPAQPVPLLIIVPLAVVMVLLTGTLLLVRKRRGPLTQA